MRYRGNKKFYPNVKSSKYYLNLRIYLKIFLYKFLPTLIYEGILRIYLGKKVFFSRKEKTFKENDIKDEISSEIALKKKDKVFYILHE